MKVYIYDDIRYEMNKGNQSTFDISFDARYPYDDRKWKIHNGVGIPDSQFNSFTLSKYDGDFSDEALKADCIKALDDHFDTMWQLELLSGGEIKAKKSEKQTTDTHKEQVGGNRVFVVHGRNLKIRDSMFQFLRSIGVNPIEWSEAKKLTKKSSPYIGEVLDFAFSHAQAIIVLFTPDDIACLKEAFQKTSDPSYEKQLTSQSRPNVIFEAGMAIGRCDDRTILIEIGQLRPFSDIAGRHVIRFDGSAEKRYELLDILQTAGVKIDIAGKLDWLKVGDFDTDDN